MTAFANKNANIEYKNSIKNVIIYYLVFTLLIIGTTVSPVFAVINFLFCIYLVIRKDETFIVPFFIFATFFASLFKILQITSMSLFTIVMLVYVLKQIVMTKKIKVKFFMPYLFFVAITIIIQAIAGTFDIARNIKFYETYIYVYFALISISYISENDVLNYKPILFALVFGVLFSSVIRILDGSVLNISGFVTEKSSDLNIGTTIYRRFSGLYGDPNYYAVNVILAMCAVIFLYVKNNMKTLLTYILLIVFTCFSVMTRSKSALLMLIVPAIMLFFANKKKHNSVLQVVYLLTLITVVYFAFLGKITWFNSITDRFKEDTDIDSLTTGRTEMWREYFRYFVNNPLKLLFGTGISTPILSIGAAHNTYIDILYHLGLIPGILYISTIGVLFTIKKIKIHRCLFNYLALLTVIVMYFFLSCLFDIDLCTNIIVTAVMFNTPINKNTD